MTTEVKPSVELREVRDDSGKTHYEAFNPRTGLAWVSEGAPVGGARLEDSVENASAFAAKNGMLFRYPYGWVNQQRATPEPPAPGIEDVRALDVQPGQTVVIRADNKTPFEAWERAIPEVKAWYPDSHVIVIPHDADMAVIDAEIEDGRYVLATKSVA